MLLFIVSLLKLMPETLLCSDIGHRSFLAAASALTGTQKGLRSITLAALFRQ